MEAALGASNRGRRDRGVLAFWRLPGAPTLDGSRSSRAQRLNNEMQATHSFQASVWCWVAQGEGGLLRAVLMAVLRVAVLLKKI